MELNHQRHPRSLETAGTPRSGFEDHSLFKIGLMKYGHWWMGLKWHAWGLDLFLFGLDCFCLRPFYSIKHWKSMFVEEMLAVVLHVFHHKDRFWGLQMVGKGVKCYSSGLKLHACPWGQQGLRIDILTHDRWIFMYLEILIANGHYDWRINYKEHLQNQDKLNSSSFQKKYLESTFYSKWHQLVAEFDFDVMKISKSLVTTFASI